MCDRLRQAEADKMKSKLFDVRFQKVQSCYLEGNPLALQKKPNYCHGIAVYLKMIQFLIVWNNYLESSRNMQLR